MAYGLARLIMIVGSFLHLPLDEETDDDLLVLIDIGSHDEVY
jgi:hypothetical protein